VREVSSILIHGYGQLTTQALHLCAHHGIAVHWLSGGGRYIGGL
jgi:CRISPR-associated protein Cas1